VPESNFSREGDLGKRTSTSFFGLPLDAKQEIPLLHASETFGCGPIRGDVIFDPSPESVPCQVILARAPTPANLGEAVRSIDNRSAEFAQAHPEPLILISGMEVTSPTVFFRIRDRHQTIALELNHPTEKNRGERLASPFGWGTRVPLSSRLSLIPTP
jgi:hypothetical protein